MIITGYKTGSDECSAEDLVDVAGTKHCRYYAMEAMATSGDSDNNNNIVCNASYVWMSRNCACTCSQIIRNTLRLKALQAQQYLN